MYLQGETAGAALESFCFAFPYPRGIQWGVEKVPLFLCIFSVDSNRISRTFFLFLFLFLVFMERLDE